MFTSLKGLFMHSLFRILLQRFVYYSPFLNLLKHVYGLMIFTYAQHYNPVSHYLLVAQTISAFIIENLFFWLLGPCDSPPVLCFVVFVSLEHVPIFGTYQMLRAHHVYQALELAVSPERPGAIDWRMVFGNHHIWVLGVLVVIGVLRASRLS